LALFGLTEKIREAYEWNALGIKLGRLRDAWTDYEKEKPVEAKAAVLNSLKHVGYQALAVVLLAVVHHFATGSALADALKDLPASVVMPAVAVGSALLINAEKWLKRKFADVTLEDAQ
jgi:hypothetical protein